MAMSQSNEEHMRASQENERTRPQLSAADEQVASTSSSESHAEVDRILAYQHMYYKVLKVELKAEKATITKQYEYLSHLVSPTTCDHPNAHLAQSVLSSAYSTLINSLTRVMYTEFLKQTNQNPTQSSSESPKVQPQVVVDIPEPPPEETTYHLPKVLQKLLRVPGIGFLSAVIIVLALVPVMLILMVVYMLCWLVVLPYRLLIGPSDGSATRQNLTEADVQLKVEDTPSAASSIRRSSAASSVRRSSVASSIEHLTESNGNEVMVQENMVKRTLDAPLAPPGPSTSLSGFQASQVRDKFESNKSKSANAISEDNSQLLDQLIQAITIKTAVGSEIAKATEPVLRRGGSEDGNSNKYDYGMFRPLAMGNDKGLSEVGDKQRQTSQGQDRFAQSLPFLFYTYNGTQQMSHPAGASLYNTYGGPSSSKSAYKSPIGSMYCTYAGSSSNQLSHTVDGFTSRQPNQDEIPTTIKTRSRQPGQPDRTDIVKLLEGYSNALKVVPPSSVENREALSKGIPLPARA